MRGSLAKRLRAHVARRYAFLSEVPLYRQRASGNVTLATQCRRAVYQAVKRNYKKRVHDGTYQRTA